MHTAAEREAPAMQCTSTPPLAPSLRLTAPEDEEAGAASAASAVTVAEGAAAAAPGGGEEAVAAAAADAGFLKRAESMNSTHSQTRPIKSSESESLKFSTC